MFVKVSAVLSLGLAAANASPDLKALFGPHVSPQTEIAESGDANFADVVGQRWSAWDPPTYFGAIKPATEADVQAIVKISGANNITFLATTNGHGTNINYGKVQNGLNINLGHFNSVDVDAANNRLTVGGATNFGEIFGPVWGAGKEVQTGNSNCVGMVGATIGGGIGSMQGMYGLIIDALESVRIVVPSGDIVNASRTENEDLFWAVRGAGANFGIITSATYNLHEQTANGSVVLATFEFPAEKNRTVWELLKEYDDDAAAGQTNMPRPMVLFPQIGFNRTTNKATATHVILYFGTIEDAQPHIDRAQALNPDVVSITNMTAPNAYITLSKGVCDNGNYQFEYNVGLKYTDVDTLVDVFDEMTDFYLTHPEYNGKTVYQRGSNQVAMQKPVSDAAFPWRDIATYVLHENVYTGPNATLVAEMEAMSRSIRAKLQSTSGNNESQVYLNYGHGDEDPVAWYGQEHLAKLRALKQQWDPTNMFGKGAPIM